MRLLGAAIVVVVCIGLARPASAARQADVADGVSALVSSLRDIILAGDPERYNALLAPSSDREAAWPFAADLVRPGAGRVVIRERDRGALPDRAEGEGHRLLLEVFVEAGDTARVATVRLDVVRDGPAPGEETQPAWRIVDQERLSNLEGLYRLTLSADKEFSVDGLSLVDEDFRLDVVRGSAFVAETRDGATGLVIVGEGRIRFAPPAAAERGQLQIFGGSGVLESPIDGAFVRLHPSDLPRRIASGALEPRPVDARDLTRARQMFSEESTRSFTLDLGDLSPEPWSLVPSYGDLVVEARTRKFGTLTYARSNNEPEDISLFDRKRRRNISIYSSARRLEQRGAAFSDDDESDYDVQHYNIEASFDPAREWMEGRVEMRIRIRVPVTSSLTIRLAEPLTAHAVVSDLHGRLLSLRVRGQNSLVVNLPETVEEDTVFTIAVAYSGRLPPLSPEREIVALGGAEEAAQPPGLVTEEPVFRPESRFVYSTRSHWYPQSPVNDYATARLKLTVPDPYDCVASGSPASSNPVRLPPRRAGTPAAKQFLFVVGQPLRYFAWVISRFELAVATDVRIGQPSGNPAGSSLAAGAVYDGLDLAIVANPRQVARGRSLEAPVRNILAYFAGLLGDVPFPSFTLAIVDSDLPGGHSPGYFALLNQPMPTTQYTWRNDPVAFEGFPQFFLAHELAHQFWGQAVGWRNYHEQWLSEGLAQYFALLYAEQVRGPAGADGLLRQMRRSVIEHADEGPISLGYRLGHLKGDSRIFRAVVYNKSALVLDMLRRLIGDQAFFQGLREFYREWRFQKAGTDDFRRTFERTTGRSLERFFDRWVGDSRIPSLRFTYDVEAPGATGLAGGTSAPHVRLVFEQQGDVFDVPVVVTLRYASGQTEDVQVNVTDSRTEHRVPLRGELRSAGANVAQDSLVFINGK